MQKYFAVIFAALFMTIGVISCGDDPSNPDDDGTVNLFFQFKTGDTFTYDYYDRDEDNNRAPDTKKILVWTVLRTDASIGGRSNVAEIQQIEYEADGVTATDTTMLYFITNAQGQILQYNLLQTVLEQFSGDVDLAAVISQISETWIQVSDTKSPSPLSWNFSGILNTIQDVEVAVVTLDVKIDMSVESSHKGRVATTVPAGTYDGAFVTDHSTPTKILAAEDVSFPPLVEIENGDALIQDAVDLHYAVDIEAGILSITMDSKTTTLIPISSPYPVNGFEMELTTFTRAE